MLYLPCNLVFAFELVCVEQQYALLTHLQILQFDHSVNEGPVTIWIDSEEL